MIGKDCNSTVVLRYIYNAIEDDRFLYLNVWDNLGIASEFTRLGILK